MLKLTALPAGLLCLSGIACGASSAPYLIADKWPLAGDGGWDYPAVDAGAHLLYLSRATHVAIVDTTTGKSVGDIGDTPGVHGIALAPDLGRGAEASHEGTRFQATPRAARNGRARRGPHEPTRARTHPPRRATPRPIAREPGRTRRND